MDYINYFKNLCESIQVYRKIVLLTNLIKTDVDFYMNLDFWKVILTNFVLNLKVY